MSASLNWVGFKTIVRKEVTRILRIWGQTIVPPAITMTLYFIIFGELIGRRIGDMGGFSKTWSHMDDYYPQTLIQTGMDEILLSDSTRLAERYEAAGVDVRLDLRDGLWHVYPMLAGYMPEATEALVRAAVFIREKTPAPLPVPAKPSVS